MKFHGSSRHKLIWTNVLDKNLKKIFEKIWNFFLIFHLIENGIGEWFAPCKMKNLVSGCLLPSCVRAIRRIKSSPACMPFGKAENIWLLILYDSYALMQYYKSSNLPMVLYSIAEIGRFLQSDPGGHCLTQKPFFSFLLNDTGHGVSIHVKSPSRLKHIRP